MLYGYLSSDLRRTGLALNRQCAQKIAKHTDVLLDAHVREVAPVASEGLGLRHRRSTARRIGISEEEFAGLDFAGEAQTSWDSLVDALDEELVIALQTLNGSERAVLLMRAIGDLHYREISECLGIPLGSVMGNLSRARQKMRDAILRARRPGRAAAPRPRGEGGRSSL